MQEKWLCISKNLIFVNFGSAKTEKPAEFVKIVADLGACSLIFNYLRTYGCIVILQNIFFEKYRQAKLAILC